MPGTQRPRTVGILAFEDMEVLDYAGPYEVFNLAGEYSPEQGLQVQAIGLTDGPVTGRGGFTVLPRASIANCASPDIVVIPGGAGTRPLLREKDALDWVRSAAMEAEMVLSVCSGALVLAAAGLLDDRRATTHHGAFQELAALSPSTEIITGRRFVQASERVWTSAGVSAGIDLALHAVELLIGAGVRDEVSREMEWGW